MNTFPRKIYFAGKLHRASLFRDWKSTLSPAMFKIVSTWHDNENVEEDEGDFMKCYTGWSANRREILHDTDFMIAFATASDALHGTLVEIGMGLAIDLPIYLVGEYPWGTWRFFDNVCPPMESIYTALNDIYTGRVNALKFPIKEALLNDPT